MNTLFPAVFSSQSAGVSSVPWTPRDNAKRAAAARRGDAILRC